jgi:ATP-dependent Zn protease
VIPPSWNAFCPCRKKRPNSAETVTVTFDDVAGVESAKEELSEVREGVTGRRGRSG